MNLIFFEIWPNFHSFKMKYQHAFPQKIDIFSTIIWFHQANAINSNCKLLTWHMQNNIFFDQKQSFTILRSYEYAHIYHILHKHTQLKLNSNAHIHEQKQKIDVVNFNYNFLFFFWFDFVLCFFHNCLMYIMISVSICFVETQSKNYTLFFSYEIKSNRLYDFFSL